MDPFSFLSPEDIAATREAFRQTTDTFHRRTVQYTRRVRKLDRTGSGAGYITTQIQLQAGVTHNPKPAVLRDIGIEYQPDAMLVIHRDYAQEVGLLTNEDVSKADPTADECVVDGVSYRVAWYRLGAQFVDQYVLFYVGLTRNLGNNGSNT